MVNKERCCDILACRDKSCCGCCLPTTTGDARRLKWTGVFIGITALVFFLLGLFVPTAIANAFEDALVNSAILSPGNAAFQLMETNHDFPMKLEIYIYNITNTREIMSGTKPNLEEIGPFVYWVYKDLLPDYNFVEGNTLLDFQYYERYVFDESLSVSRDDVKIYQSNMPFWGVSSAMIRQGGGQLLDFFVQTVATDEKYDKVYEDQINMAFTYRSVRETLFGYPDDPLMNCIADAMGDDAFSRNYAGIISNATSPDHARTLLPTNETISTGVDSRARARRYIKYRGLDYIDGLEAKGKCPWGSNDDPLCRVRGIDGAATLPFNNATATNDDLAFDFWYPSLSRAVNFVFDERYREEGIDFYRFRFNPNEWHTASEWPPNTPYDITTGGVIPLSKALTGSPVSITRPRQLRISDEKFTSNVSVKFLDDGKRNPEDEWSMDTHFDFEKRTGSTLRFTSTSEMVISVAKVEFEYDDSFVILTIDQIQELDQIVRDQYAQVGMAPQSLPSAKLLPLMEQFSQQNEKNGRSSTLSTQQQHQSVQDDDDLDTYYGGMTKPCGFGPNTSHCTGTHVFQKMSTMFQQNKRQRRHDELSTQQEFTDIQTVTYLDTIATANIPFFWGNQTGGISQKDLHALGAAFSSVDNTIRVLPIICFFIALVLILLGAFFMIRGSQYQSALHRDAGHLDEYRQDGDISDQHHQQYANQNDDKVGYNDTLDALDLDPIYSNDYAQRSNGAAASSLHISQSSRPTNIQPHTQQGYNRSYSTASSRKNFNRDRSFEPLSPVKPNNYGGADNNNNKS